VAENFETYGKYHKLSYALLIGGVSFADQESRLDRGVDVLIATPGRLLDQFERGKVLLNDVKLLVIDEADRMLDMGFIPDVERIVSLLPKIRQTLFFSATMPPEIRRLADAFLMNPKEISVSPPASPAANVTQGLVRCSTMEKRQALRDLIKSEEVKNALIFCNRKRDIGVLVRSLERHGLDVGALHGDMHQSQRTETLDAFRAGKIRLLVCSDVAARGLDIDDLSHVFNFDVPRHPEDYVHRIGRTGRAGKSGRAFTLATAEDGKFLAAIERLIGCKIPPVTVSGLGAEADAPAEPAAEERGSRRPRSRRGERKPRQAEAEAQAEPSNVTRFPGPRAEPGRSEQHRGPHRQERGREERNRGRERDRDDGGKPVVGLGDHVPAFLLRPVRVSSAGD
jgi:superfamily II DNA/RNA helicase